MNSHIETAIVTNLKTKFPLARIFTGKVVQGIAQDDIIVNCVYDDINFFKGSNYRQRESSISVTVIQPTSETIVDDLADALKSFTTANGNKHYPETLTIDKEDDTVKVLFDIVHIEN